MRWIVGIILVVLSFTLPQDAYTQQSRERNLQTCLSGKYPALCDYSLLMPEQRRQAQTAELRENLHVCKTGKYPALCNHAKLTPDEARTVRAAEQAENLRVCSTGKYPTLCRRDLLSADEITRVRAAERAENLRVCMDGRYPTLCNHSLLEPEEAKVIAAAEAKAASAGPLQAAKPGHPSRSRGSGCESGHWIEAVEGAGKIIKLENGSLWEVDDVDTVTTSIWLPVSAVVVCDGKMINVDDGEAVAVTPVNPDAPPRQGFARRTTGYRIEASANDETFVINGEVFKAKTYCFNFEKGDAVKFVSGSPFGACTTATILNLRSGKTCKVWCE